MEIVTNYLICQANQNATSSANATADVFVASTSDKTFAYFSLCLMTILPIVLGSFRSVKHHKKQQVSFAGRARIRLLTGFESSAQMFEQCSAYGR